MTSFDCRLKAIKACSACGNLHTSAFCCSKEKLKNKILVPMPESSQQHIKIERICFDCGDLLHGLNCLECDLTRKILEKAFQKFQNTSKSSNDNSNVVNAPREPFVVKQDPSVNSSQKSPLIDQKCCCECGDSLDGIFCQQCTLSEYINTPAWNRPLVYCDDDDDEDYTIAITPVLSTEEPVNSLIMEDEHLDTISATESDEFIKGLVLNPCPNPILLTFQKINLEDFSDSNVDFLLRLMKIPSLVIRCRFPPADRSDFYHEEFADGLAHIISPPEYDHFCFKIEPELCNFTMDVDCPDCEDSQFCHSSRVSHPQLHLGNRYS
ncbi:hypothetical protein Tco_1491510 [Tanacetum coccineum]